MAALICIKRVRGTFCQLVNIANRFLRIFSNIEASIRFIFPGGAGYPYLPTRLHAQFIPFQSFANSGRWRCKWHVDEDQGVDDDFLHEHNYKCRTQFLWFPLSSFIHTNNIKRYEGLFLHNCICSFTMMVLCRHKLRFPKHGRSQVKKVLYFYMWYDHRVVYVERWFSALIYPEHHKRPGECCNTYQVTVHVAGYVIGGMVMSAERSVQLVSQVGK